MLMLKLKLNGLPVPLKLQFIRFFALSRFPQRRLPSGGRIRQRTPAVTQRVHPSASATEHPNSQKHESSFGFDGFDTPHSTLPEENKRPPVSNPELGLKRLLQNNSLVVTRQLEMLNIFIGFEQTNKYVISNEVGETLGFIAEEPRGLLASFSRQILRTHRPFRAVIMDHEGKPVLWIRRPFAWINSRMHVQRLKDWHEHTTTGEPVLDTFGEAQQRWHLWRRRYDLFSVTLERILSNPSEPEPDRFAQFAKIDEGFWAWHFTVRGSHGEELASISRAFRGFGREIFTDTGQYTVNFTPLPSSPEDNTSREPYVTPELSLQQRAVRLLFFILGFVAHFDRSSYWQWQ
ncbi:Scramblase-domain-containing protein [Multifurca ochricompacta]|uniref:Phospholipid scramblase n=1 Tax=Multifurca ochricompacta TaxID=376703 RepID=A0AAD4MBH2_9AGAM|nr:Scramblase-domain-containing protein [Multifurca ochricompacta]